MELTPRELNPSSDAPSRESGVPLEVYQRARREREFFNRYSEAEKIPDKLLLVTETFEVPPEIDRLKSHLRGKTVCDYGCGYGVTSSYFALQGAMTYAFDVSEIHVQIARHAARLNGVEERVRLHVMAGECLGFPDDFFDLVYGSAVLHHVDLPLAAREIYRVLKPGGIAVFRDPLGENTLLEWARRCPLRSVCHSKDERSLLYSDIQTLRSVFSDLSFRETGLFTLIQVVLREVGLGTIAGPRWQKALRRLGQLDHWIFTHLPVTRPLAQYIVISVSKPERGSPGFLREVGKVAEFPASSRSPGSKG